MQISLNDSCKVVLTSSGAAHVNKVNQQCNDLFYTKQNLKFIAKTNYNEADVYTGQLWHIIELFGSSISLGCEPPFVNAEIIVKEN